jgi:hypothetical protein
MTPTECLDYVRRARADAQDVLVCGYDVDGDFFTFSSHMSRKDALWLAMMLVDYARGLD